MWKFIKNIFRRRRNRDFKQLIMENPLWFEDAYVYSQESSFRSQPFSFPRFSKDNPATLGYLIKELFPDCYDKIKEAVNLSVGGCNLRRISDVDEIKQIRPIELTLTEYPKLEFHNVFVVIFDNSADIKEVVFHFIGIAGYHCNTPYVRVSVMIPEIKDNDTLRTQLSFGTSDEIVVQFSFIIVEDRADNSRLLETYEAVHEKLKRDIENKKKIKPTFIEHAIIEGCYSFRSVDYYIKYGDELILQKRWFDAYRQYIRAYYALCDSLLRNENDELNKYRALAHKLGLCLTELNRWDEAVYFLSKDLLNEELNDTLLEFGSLGAKQTDTVAFQQQNEKLDNNINKLTIGDLFSLLYGVVRNSLECMVVTNDNTSENFSIYDSSALWDTSLDVVLKDKTTAVIKYSHVKSVINDNEDNSKLCRSAFVIRTHKVKSDDNLMRVTIMLPPFNEDYDKICNQELHIPQGVSFIVGSCITNRKKESYFDKIKLCDKLFSEKRFIELSFEAKEVFHSLVNKRNELTENERALLNESAYYVGFAYHDLNLKEKAYYYLLFASKANMSFMKEYVNCIVNLKHPLALNIIDDAIKDFSLDKSKEENNTSDSFYYYLLRRKLWLLIESNKLDEADKVVLLLQNATDPFTKQYVEKEIEYIKQLRYSHSKVL